MTIIDRALEVWAHPAPSLDETRAAFDAVYTDPVTVNGTSVPLLSLVQRARMLQGAISGLHHEVLQRVEQPHGVAMAFELSGRHVGALDTPAGSIPPTGRPVTVLGLDIFEVTGDRVSAVWAVADHLGLLLDLGATVSPPPLPVRSS